MWEGQQKGPRAVSSWGVYKDAVRQSGLPPLVQPWGICSKYNPTGAIPYHVLWKACLLNYHHFEINTGIGFIHNKVISRNNGIPYSYGSYGAGPSETDEPLSEPVNESNYFSIVGNLGYRYQSQENSTVFKFGVGFPELLHIGLGVSF